MAFRISRRLPFFLLSRLVLPLRLFSNEQCQHGTRNFSRGIPSFSLYWLALALGKASIHGWFPWQVSVAEVVDRLFVGGDARSFEGPGSSHTTQDTFFASSSVSFPLAGSSISRVPGCV